jgi:hypothetical protein
MMIMKTLELRKQRTDPPDKKRSTREKKKLFERKRKVIDARRPLSRASSGTMQHAARHATGPVPADWLTGPVGTVTVQPPQ